VQLRYGNVNVVARIADECDSLDISGHVGRLAAVIATE
jgi:hypothetical protein